jgi:lysylphosphatidylglycerol synthetase-like protein (DUF2156 family)
VAKIAVFVNRNLFAAFGLAGLLSLIATMFSTKTYEQFLDGVLFISATSIVFFAIFAFRNVVPWKKIRIAFLWALASLIGALKLRWRPGRPLGAPAERPRRQGHEPVGRWQAEFTSQLAEARARVAETVNPQMMEMD